MSLSEHAGSLVPKEASGAIGLVASLRRLQDLMPLSQVLSSVGVGLVTWGFTWGLARLLRHYPHVIIFFVGVSCLIGAALARPEGLLTLLPPGVQDTLLRTTVFDLIHDDSTIQNMVRRWMRVQMLCADRSEAEVDAIVRGLDPAFVSSVFQGNLLYWLPPTFRRILLPTGDACKLDPSIYSRPAESDGSFARLMTSADIAKHVRMKNEAKMLRITEPELIPAVVGSITANAMDAGRRIALWGSRLFTVSALWLVGSAALLGLKQPRSMLLQGLSRSGVGAITLTEHGAARASRYAVAFAALSAGAAVILRPSSRTASIRPDASGCSQLRWAPFYVEPEREKSPSASEVSPGD